MIFPGIEVNGHNLTNDFPEKTMELHDGILEDWRQRVGAPIPAKRNPMYDCELETKHWLS